MGNFQDSVVSGEKSGGLGQLMFMRIRPAALVLMFLAPCLHAQSHAEYMGGTAPGIERGNSGAIEMGDPHYFAFYTKKGQVRVAYDRIDLVEYGQQVDRRVLMALVTQQPWLLLSKKRKHFLTIGYTDEDGNHQALVFQVDKNGIRATLVSLEARTGLKIEYQDEEARKAGRG